MHWRIPKERKKKKISENMEQTPKQFRSLSPSIFFKFWSLRVPRGLCYYLTPRDIPLKIVTRGVKNRSWKLRGEFPGSHPYLLAVIFFWGLSSNSLEYLMFSLIPQIPPERKIVNQKSKEVMGRKTEIFWKICWDAKLNNNWNDNLTHHKGSFTFNLSLHPHRDSVFRLSSH